MEEAKTRTFICVTMPENVVKEIARVQEVLLGKRFTGKMTELENLHVTLKFLGEIDAATVKKAREKLKEVKFEAFEAKLSEIGTFAHRGKPRIVWVKVGGKRMFELQERVDAALAGLFAPERRFMSHLTIARVKYVADNEGFQEYVRRLSVREEKFIVDKFILMKSELYSSGAEYTEIEAYHSMSALNS